MRTLIALLCLHAIGVAAASGQHDHAHSPYADAPVSEIPALTPEELVGLGEGAGLGMARAAELNHYPGPKHVLELADALELSAEQRARVLEIFDAMHHEAVELGGAIIEAERRLDRRFKHRHIDSAALAEATAAIGRLRGRLRYIHLAAHLATAEVLEAEQIESYDRLRGYGEPEDSERSPEG